MNPTDSPSGHARRKRITLAWLRRWWSRVIAGLAFAVVAGVTGRISYIHIQELTLALHQPPLVARLMPFGVDGLIVVGSMALLQAVKGQEWLGWLCVAPGAAASLFANVESGLPWGPLPAAWAGVASMSFILAVYTLERWLKGQFGAGSRADELTTEEVLRMLVATDTERGLAETLGVDRNRVQGWKRQLVPAAETPPTDGGRDVPAAPRVPAASAANGHHG